MADVTQGLRNGGPGRPQQPLIFGYVSRSKPAPTQFDDPLYVVLPGLSTDYSYGPCKWAELHGASKPHKGAEVLVAFDDRGVPIVVWWAGTHT